MPNWCPECHYGVVEPGKKKCDLCLIEKKVERYQANRLKRFDLDPYEYDQLLKKQNGVCAICGKPETAKRKDGKLLPLSVDHKHDGTKKVRGLLCSNCNRGIGMFQDDPERLERAAAYLRQNDEKVAA